MVQENGDGLRLGGVERRIWEHLEYAIALRGLIDRLAAEFDDPRQQISEEAGSFLDDLRCEGFVEVTDRAPTPGELQRQRYLWLLKRSLVNLLYPELELCVDLLRKEGRVPAESQARDRYLRDIRYVQANRFDALLAAKQFGTAPRHSHTMIGCTGLDNLERCAEQVFADGVEGDFLEAGICKGGACIFLRALQIAFGEPHRRVWAADSFQGVPQCRHEADVAHAPDLTEERFPWLYCSLEAVRDNFSRYGLLDEGVHFLPGWFRDTLSVAPIERLALLRLDGDLYESTRDALEALYDKVAPGGFIVVDDYGSLDACKRAVDEFRSQQRVVAPLHCVDQHRVFWRKS